MEDTLNFIGGMNIKLGRCHDSDSTDNKAWHYEQNLG